MTVAPNLPSGTSRRPGMTLIEVLLGLAIFLLALVAIGRLVDIGADLASEATLQTDGTRLAQSKLAEVEAGAISPSAGGSGTCEDEPSWTWSVESTPAGVPNLFSVTVTLSHNFRGKPLQVVLSQMVYDPNMMGTAAQIPRPTPPEEATTTGGTTP